MKQYLAGNYYRFSLMTMHFFIELTNNTSSQNLRNDYFDDASLAVQFFLELTGGDL